VQLYYYDQIFEKFPQTIRIIWAGTEGRAGRGRVSGNKQGRDWTGLDRSRIKSQCWHGWRWVREEIVYISRYDDVVLGFKVIVRIWVPNAPRIMWKRKTFKARKIIHLVLAVCQWSFSLFILSSLWLTRQKLEHVLICNCILDLIWIF
jgi:hypothetical protein